MSRARPVLGDRVGERAGRIAPIMSDVDAAHLDRFIDQVASGTGPGALELWLQLTHGVTAAWARMQLGPRAARAGLVDEYSPPEPRRPLLDLDHVGSTEDRHTRAPTGPRSAAHGP